MADEYHTNNEYLKQIAGDTENEYHTNNEYLKMIAESGGGGGSSAGATPAEHAQIYQNKDDIEQLQSDLGDYAKTEEVETAIISKGYQTSQQVENAITSKGYQPMIVLQSGVSTNTHLQEVNGNHSYLISWNNMLALAQFSSNTGWVITDIVGNMPHSISGNTLSWGSNTGSVAFGYFIMEI